MFCIIYYILVIKYIYIVYIYILFVVGIDFNKFQWKSWGVKQLP